MKINRDSKLVLFLLCCIVFSGYGSNRDNQPVLGSNPIATHTQLSTATPTVTPTSAFTPTYTATASPIPIRDRELSEIVLQLYELPDGYRDLASWSGPGCISEVYQSYMEVHTNLIHGYARDFESGNGNTFIASSLFVYGFPRMPGRG